MGFSLCWIVPSKNRTGRNCLSYYTKRVGDLRSGMLAQHPKSRNHQNSRSLRMLSRQSDGSLNHNTAINSMRLVKIETGIDGMRYMHSSMMLLPPIVKN